MTLLLSILLLFAVSCEGQAMVPGPESTAGQTLLPPPALDLFRPQAETVPAAYQEQGYLQWDYAGLDAATVWFTVAYGGQSVDVGPLTNGLAFVWDTRRPLYASVRSFYFVTPYAATNAAGTVYTNGRSYDPVPSTCFAYTTNLLPFVQVSNGVPYHVGYGKAGSTYTVARGDGPYATVPWATFPGSNALWVLPDSPGGYHFYSTTLTTP